ncbi:hypothetical protein FSARC_9651 [Fusarium sarcochroum]|uniref:Uncharacterized protein n=1 Tax=Fusarium sarcochroum TaxID=1208366 RepID=A0A8H4TQV7_9HYPO|nr:hypothetical protein FSARC_9651 [Fusarium sarcochroum]
MISTTQVQNGFCRTLVPMALSSQCASAHALLNAMQAVSAIHHTSSIAAAAQFKLKAVHNLTKSLTIDQCSTVPEASEIQLAAAMMLCVYDVFDKEEGSWHIHLRGAKDIVRRQRFVANQSLDSDFLLTWLLYHDVLAAFTQPSWGSASHQAERDLLFLLQGFGVDRTFIVGSLGCSVEVLEIIHWINGMRLTTTQHSESLMLQRCDLEARLFNLRQELEPGEKSESLRSSRILATAELYRLAALLYLQRVCPSTTDDTTRVVYVQQAIRILQSMEVATSPWPVFIVACEIPDEERVGLLRTLDHMDSVRSIGNTKVLRKVIEGIWKQYDLRSTSESCPKNDWLQFVDCEVPVPWFI